MGLYTLPQQSLFHAARSPDTKCFFLSVAIWKDPLSKIYFAQNHMFWVEMGNLSPRGPAPELSNLPTIRLFKLKLPTKTRKCHFRHFRDKTCVNHRFRLEKGNNCVKIKIFWSLQIVCLKWQVLGATSLLQLLLFWFELCIYGQTCPPNPNLPSISNTEMPQFWDRVYQMGQQLYLLPLGQTALVDATKKGSIARLGVHSCNPSAEVKPWLVEVKFLQN